jgi:hypothetical protein
MDSSYKGYYLEEENNKIFIYDTLFSWRNRFFLTFTDNESKALAWIDNEIKDMTKIPEIPDEWLEGDI